MMQTIGLIGLGNAGRPMAQRIMAQGYQLNVFDIDPAAIDATVKLGARAARSPADTIADVTITLLPSSMEVTAAVFGDHGALGALGPGKTLIDLSGTDPDCARELQACLAEKGAAFIGGTIHANGAPALTMPTGQFAIVVGGAKPQLEAVVKVLNDIAQTVICLPEPWMPKAFKIAVILFATTNNIVTAEVCSWLTAQGADPKLFLKLLQTTGSAPTASRLEEFMKRDNNNGGALSNSYKDFRQALKVAANLEIPMPLVSMANQIQEMGRANGLKRVNSPAAMGKLYELITGEDLSGATLASEKKLRSSPEAKVVWLKTE
jgi:3-hydroxyisobutyrate dehydrogenase-like beta-hydroxyacid dehydrogenase